MGGCGARRRFLTAALVVRGCWREGVELGDEWGLMQGWVAGAGVMGGGEVVGC